VCRTVVLLLWQELLAELNEHCALAAVCTYLFSMLAEVCTITEIVNDSPAVITYCIALLVLCRVHLHAGVALRQC
jgi:hypothetical protein